MTKGEANAMTTDADFLAALSSIVGAANVLTAPGDQDGYLTEPRGLYRGETLAVVRPASTDEVSRIVSLCRAQRRSVTPHGGGTGLVGGQIAHDRHGVLLSLSRMTSVREVDVSSNTMIVEAGVTLAQAQDAATRADRLFPLSLASEGSCTIGGNLSTNAGGTAVLAYGNARDLTLGVEVVLSDGRVMSLLSKLRKDNTGYDLKDLFIGAEGTLGIITAATLKLFPRPRATQTAFIGLESPEQALGLLALAQKRAGAQLVTFEILPRIGLDFVLKHAEGVRDPLADENDWYVLMELSSTAEKGLDAVMEGLLEAALDEGLIDDAAVAASGAQRDDFWRLREMLSEVQKHEGGSIKHDVSVPVARVPEFLDVATDAVLELEPMARVVAFGHVGDGNIHFNVSQPIGADKETFLARWEEFNAVVHEIVLEMDGSISAEHGVGTLKRDLLPGAKDAVALDVMRAIKIALDPDGVMNPGKVLTIGSQSGR
jgi:FAD/FMN-containing dehydrogenase